MFYNNTLLGVYNTGAEASRNCVIQYFLSAKGDSVKSEKILNSGHPSFADPTTAALYKHQLYVLANSHLDSYNKNTMATQGIEEKLRPVTLLTS